MLLVEWGLKVKNEKAHGAVYDLNSTIQSYSELRGGLITHPF